MCTSGGINDEGYHGGEARGKGFCDDGARCRPRKDLYLAGSVNNHVFERWVTLLLTKADDLQQQIMLRHLGLMVWLAA